MCTVLFAVYFSNRRQDSVVMSLVLTGRPFAPIHFSKKTDVGDRDRLCVDFNSSLSKHFSKPTSTNQVVGRHVSFV